MTAIYQNTAELCGKARLVGGGVLQGVLEHYRWETCEVFHTASPRTVWGGGAVQSRFCTPLCQQKTQSDVL